MKKWLVLAAVFGIVGNSWAQSLNDYLALRKENQISKSSRVDALDDFVGRKVFELKCIVTGSLEVDGKKSIYVRYADNKTEQGINATTVPDWLKSGEVAARLLVVVTKAEKNGNMEIELLGAASESEVSTYEAAHAPKPAPPVKATTKAATPTVRRGSMPSRGGKVARVKGDPRIVGIYANFIKNYNKKLSNGQAYEIAQAIIDWSLTYDIDARLVVAVIITESDFNPGCISRANAMGLGQLMAENCSEYGITNVWDANQNLYGTVRQLREHLDRYPGAESDPNKLALMLAAYNAGPGAVKRFGGVPPYRETQNYIKRVFSRYRQLCGHRA